MMRNVWIGAIMALIAVVIFNILGVLGTDIGLGWSVLIVIGVGIVFGIIAALIRYVRSRSTRAG